MKKLQNILLFFILFGAMFIFGMVDNIKGVSLPLIKMGFNATDLQQGFMVSMLSMSYVVFCIVAGIFLSRFGLKPSFLAGLSTVILGLAAIFYMPDFYSTAAALFIIFAGFGFIEIGINALAAKVFFTKTALLMNMLHALYGLGAMLGPIMAGTIIAYSGFSWRHAYIFSMPLAFIIIIPAIFTRFPGDKETIQGNAAIKENRISFFDTLRSPIMWLMAVTLGLSIVVEMLSSNWGSLYFQEVYGMDPAVEGARFLSAFYLLFTISRLVSGLLIEKTGYTRALLGVAIMALAVFIIGFSIGEKGIFVLPILGFFVALLWPTIMAVAVVIFRKNASVYCSAIIAIGGLISAPIQFFIGYTNKLFGPAWGYRSGIVYTVLLIFVLVLLHRKFKKTVKQPW